MKTWKQMKPHNIKSRKNMYKKYGAKCFLEPKRLKYPICNKYNGKPQCIGHYSARYYLNINIGKLRKKKDKLSKIKQKKYFKLLNKSQKYTLKKCNKNKIR